jgi:predicted HTH transcriptional regulator
MIIIGVQDATCEVVGVPDNRIGETLDVMRKSRPANDQARTAFRSSGTGNLYGIGEEHHCCHSEAESWTHLSGSRSLLGEARDAYRFVRFGHSLLEMANDRGLVDWEHQPVLHADMEDIDEEKVNAYLERRMANNRHTARYRDRERVLVGMRCAVVTNDDKVVPTNAGLLFFGIHPQEHLLQSDVACVLFRETVGASRYADRRILTGTL